MNHDWFLSVLALCTRMKIMFVVRYSVHIPDIFLNLPGYTQSYTQGHVDQYYIGGGGC